MLKEILPFSEACERNKRPILGILKNVFADCRKVLEIGSGTAQHAVYFGKILTYLKWQPSDILENLELMQERIKQEASDNVLSPIVLNVLEPSWLCGEVDAVFAANVFHISPRKVMDSTFKGIGKVLRKPGKVCIYGPFRYQGQYTSASNAQFDAFLRNTDPNWGIRNFEEIQELARLQGLQLEADHSMPANNQLIVFRTAHTYG